MADPSRNDADTQTGPESAAEPARRRRLHRLRAAVRHRRERIRDNPTLNHTYRIALAAFGTAVLIAGLVLVPYPGPGWLIVFAGLGILATEFHWAHRVNVFAKRQYHRWIAWLGRQHWATKLVVAGATGVIVVTTLWLLGTFSLVGHLVGVHWHWLASPLFGT